MNAKVKYQLFWFCVKTITSAPSRIVLVLKPLPSDPRSNINSTVRGSRQLIHKKLQGRIPKTIHCPMKASDCLSENPKLMQRLSASGSIPPPSSYQCKSKTQQSYNPDNSSYENKQINIALKIQQPWTNNEGFPSRGFLNLLTRTNVAPLFTWEKICHRNNHT